MEISLTNYISSSIYVTAYHKPRLVVVWRLETDGFEAHHSSGFFVFVSQMRCRDTVSGL